MIFYFKMIQLYTEKSLRVQLYKNSKFDVVTLLKLLICILFYDFKILNQSELINKFEIVSYSHIKVVIFSCV